MSVFMITIRDKFQDVLRDAKDDLASNIKPGIRSQELIEIATNLEEIEKLEQNIDTLFDHVPIKEQVEDEDEEEDDEEDDDLEDDEEEEEYKDYYDQYEKEKLEELVKEVDGRKRKTRNTGNYSFAKDLALFSQNDRDIQVLLRSNYGKDLYARYMSIADSTGYHTRTSLITQHFEQLFRTLPYSIALEKRYYKGKTKCYLCDGIHDCKYQISIRDQSYPLGANCFPVAEAIVDLLSAIYEEDPDYNTWHDNIEDAFLVLQDTHYGKNRKNRKH